MSSTFVTRLKVGEILVDAKGVSRLVSRRIGVWPLVRLLRRLAALVAALAVAGAAPRPALRERLSASRLASCRVRPPLPRRVARGRLPDARGRDPDRRRHLRAAASSTTPSATGFNGQIAELAGARSTPRARRDEDLERRPAGGARTSSRAPIRCSSTSRLDGQADRRARPRLGRARRSTSSSGAIDDGDGRLARMRAVTLPLRLEAVESTLADAAGARRLRRRASSSANLGRDLGRELAAGGETPLWDALAGEIVEERSGDSREPADGVVVIRDAPSRRRAPTLAVPRRPLPGARQHRRARRRRRADPGRAERDPGLPALTASRPSTGSTPSSAGSRSCSCSADADPGDYGVRDTATTGSCRRSSRCPSPVAEPLDRSSIAARDEEARIGTTVAELRRQFPDARDPRRRRRLARRDGATSPSGAGARVVRLPRRGKGQALTLAEREAPPGALLLCDADLRGDLRPLARRATADLTIAAFAAQQGGGFGIAKGTARRADPARVRLRGARAALGPAPPHASRRARPCFPLAAGFGCETRMTIDAVRAGLGVDEVELAARAPRDRPRPARLPPPRPPAARHPARVRPAGAQPPRPAAAARRLGRRPSRSRSSLPVAAIGLADDLWSGEERGFRAHLRARAHDRRPEARRHPARSGSGGRARSRARCSSASPRTR